jgi:hypothetical protein
VRRRLLVPMFLAVLTAACSTPSTLRLDSAVPLGSSNAFSSEDAQRMVVVAVDNSSSIANGRVGSTPRGYDAAALYVAGSVARRTVTDLAHDYRMQEVSGWPIAALRMHCIVFRLTTALDREQVLQRLTRDPRVKLAQPMNDFSTSGQLPTDADGLAGKAAEAPRNPNDVAYNDPYVNLQRGFVMMHAAAAHHWSRGEGVRVAVIDTGVDRNHPDLKDRIVHTANFVDANAAAFARDRHGTAVAGIIGATGNNGIGIVGIAPGVKLIAIKACWQLTANSDAARCNSFTLAQALAEAMDANAQIVNLSLSGPPDPLLQTLIERGIERGMVFVGAAAAGFPASAPGVLAVVTAEPHAARTHALPAPGTEILTTQPAGRYDFSSGASLATAHITGLVALLLQQSPNLRHGRLSALLHNSVAGDAANHWVDSCTALASLLARPSCSDINLALHTQ